MMLAGDIVWLASYPKSGNTWIRVIISALLADPKQAQDPDINSLELADHAGSRALIEAVSACPSSELYPDEVELLRPAAFRFLTKKKGLVFVKVHDTYRLLDRSTPLFPTDVSRQVIYILRNPLDVVVSFAAHLGIAIDDAIALMASNHTLGAEDFTIGPQIPQQIGSWSGHVQSWTQQQDIPVHVVRYEDLETDVEAELARIVQLLELPVSKSRIVAATRAACFDRLQSAERRAGFREKPASLQGLFFRSGRSGGWRQTLSSEQIKRLTENHLDTMSHFGYLSHT